MEVWVKDGSKTAEPQKGPVSGAKLSMYGAKDFDTYRGIRSAAPFFEVYARPKEMLLPTNGLTPLYLQRGR